MRRPLQRLTPVTLAATLLVCVLSSASIAEGLSGATRTAFVEATMRGCVNKALEDKGASTTLVSQSCTCFAEGLADSTSNEELLSLVRLAPDARDATMQPRIDALRKSCLGGRKTQ